MSLKSNYIRDLGPQHGCHKSESLVLSQLGSLEGIPRRNNSTIMDKDRDTSSLSSESMDACLMRELRS